jgi:hypothetical protein
MRSALSITRGLHLTIGLTSTHFGTDGAAICEAPFIVLILALIL